MTKRLPIVVLATTILFAISCNASFAETIEITDTFTLTPGWIEWTETQYYPYPSVAIEENGWLSYYARGYLVNQQDIYMKLYETFNWTIVNQKLGYNNSAEFQTFVTENPVWWLEWNWGYNPSRFGILHNKTFIDVAIDDDLIIIETQFHITNVPEFLIGWSFGFAGYDMRSLSVGKTEIYEYVLDFTIYDQYTYYHIKSPSSILQETGNFYNVSIYLAPWTRNTISSSNIRTIISMPSTTEIIKVEPEEISAIDRNIVTFDIHESTIIPESFFIVSGPPIKSPSVIILEAVTSPDGVAAIIGLAVLFPSLFEGTKMFRRNRTYNRMIRVLVKLYDEHKNDPKLSDEMIKITDSIFKLFIENKITDTQFEKLLNRRDDFIERNNKLVLK